MNVERQKSLIIRTDNVFRYMGMRPEAAEPRLKAEVEKAEKNFLKTVEGYICWDIIDKTDISAEEVKIGEYCFKSISLKKHLESCEKVIVMAATLGAEADRLRIRAAAVSQLNELIYDALGTEGIESVCDQFCYQMEEKYGKLTSRFSPGYGDLALEYQKDMVTMLDTQKRIGVTLLDSLLMTPTKSVTAFVGIKQ